MSKLSEYDEQAREREEEERKKLERESAERTKELLLLHAQTNEAITVARDNEKTTKLKDRADRGDR